LPERVKKYELKYLLQSPESMTCGLERDVGGKRIQMIGFGIDWLKKHQVAGAWPTT
jgi:hypothetical protein